jgi:hypothetical protein
MLSKMFTLLDLTPPDLDIQKPGWVGVPSSNFVFAICIFIYYISVSGITYDIVNSPPSFGVESDDFGNTRPVAFLKWQLNQQYIVEGFTAGFMMVLASSGFIILDQTHSGTSAKMGHMLLTGLGFAFTLLGSCACYTFFRIKWPVYWEDMFLQESK